jgi:two-component system sensor histidine kinase AlgZ
VTSSRMLPFYTVAIITTAGLAASVVLLWRVDAPVWPIILSGLPPSLLLGFITFAARYLCRAMPLRTTGAVRLIVTHGGTAAVASSLWLATWAASAASLGAPAASRPIFVLGLLLYFAAVVVHYLMLEVETAREAEEAALRYRVLAREAELRAFKAQVDPHFLFNSLNAVASLCGSRPLDAREMAQRLAEFYRLILRLGSLDRITLGQEIDLVSRYLAIEKVRFGERLTTNIAVEEGAAECMVPPLLLQPLVENAVRHGIASVVEGGTIDIAATLHDGKLRISIDNPADPDRTDSHGEGVGLQNAAGRLSAVSDGKAVVLAGEDAGRFHVAIELPR